ncbi:MAG: hypothetical protein RSA71_05755, partial [Eubacterium sp.]
IGLAPSTPLADEDASGTVVAQILLTIMLAVNTAASDQVVAGIVAIMTLMTWVVDSGLGALAALLIGSK